MAIQREIQAGSEKGVGKCFGGDKIISENEQTGAQQECVSRCTYTHLVKGY